MSNETINDITGGSNMPMAVPDAPRDWRGMTLEELRRARGKALVRREVGRASVQYNLDSVKSNVASNGVRALMFSPGYVLLGFRITRWLMGMRSSRRRRRR